MPCTHQMKVKKYKMFIMYKVCIQKGKTKLKKNIDFLTQFRFMLSPSCACGFISKSTYFYQDIDTMINSNTQIHILNVM